MNNEIKINYNDGTSESMEWRYNCPGLAGAKKAERIMQNHGGIKNIEFISDGKVIRVDEIDEDGFTKVEA